MAGSFDELYIELTADAVKANDSIDRLSQKLGRLSTSLSSLNSSNLIGLANGVQRLSASMQGMKSVGTADFTRLTRNLNSIGTINTASLNRLASATTMISKSFNGLAGSQSGIKAVGDLATGIKQLGFSSSTKAIDNIPKLAVAMRQLMTELSKAPQVSKNVISMTNALAKLARTGGSAGTAANSLSKNLNTVPSATRRASSGFKSLASTIGKVYATYWLLFRAFSTLSKAMTLSSNLTEVENVINHTFGALRTRIDDFTKDSIEKFGLAELAAKQYAGRFQAMGKAMGISNNAMAQSTEFLNEKLGDSAKIYGNLGNSMADMSINLTKLTSDYASFFDVAQSDVAEDFQSIFTGQTKPLRAYGLDLTATTLKEWALNNGLNANLKTMTQAEKAMLRYEYVMAHSQHIMGDFARTSDTWHNTIVRLKNNLQVLGTTVGKMFINLLKPLAVFVNNAIVGLNKVAIAVSNALGKLLGWKYEEGSGGMTTDYEDAADAAGEMADGTGKAAKAAKELKKQLQGIDELNVLHTNDDNNGGGGSGSGGTSGTGGGETGTDGSWVKTSGMFDSDVKTWEDLGKKIGGWLKTAMDNIPWNEVYQKAGKFGENLAGFINGLFAKDEDGRTVLDSLGTTIAGGLKSAIIFAFTLGKGIKWSDIGDAIAGFFNSFFAEMNKIDPVTGMTGWEALAETLNTWVDGLKTTLITAVKKINWGDVLKGAFGFANGLELDTIAITLGAIAWMYGGKEIVFGALKSLLASEVTLGIGDATVSLGTAIVVSIATAKIGFEIGKWLYNNTSFSKFSDAVAAWMVDENGDIKILQAIGVTVTGLMISLGTLALAKWAFNGIQYATASMLATGLRASIGTTISSGVAAAGSIPLQVGIAVGVFIAGFTIGNYLYNNVPKVQEMADALVELCLGGYTPAEISNAMTGVQVDWGITIAAKIMGVTIDDNEKSKMTSKLAEILGGGKALSGMGNPSYAIDLVVKSFELGKNIGKVIPGMIAQFVSWVKDPASFKNDVTGMISKFSNWIKDTTFGNTIGNMIASFVSWVLDTSFGHTIGDMIAKFTKKDDKDVKGSSIDSTANITKASPKKGLKTTLDKVTANITKYTDNIGKKNKKIEFKAVISSVGIPSSAVAAMKKAGWTVEANGGIFKHGNWHNIPQYAAGGFPDHGSMFIAGEAGAEVVGHVNGRTEVLNQSQMASTMYNAVISANSEQNALLRQQNALLNSILQKETGITYKDVFKAAQYGNREYKAINGVSGLI